MLHEPCEIPLHLLRLQYVDFTRDYNKGLQRLLPVMKGTDSEHKPNATQAAASTSTPAPSAQPAYTEPLAEVFPCSSEASMKSPGGYDYAPPTVVNKRQDKVTLYWLDGNRNRSRKFKYDVEAGKTEKFEDTLIKDHILVVTAANGDCIKLVRVPGLVTVE